MYKKVYDYKTYTHSKQKSEVYTADKNGYFKLSNATIKDQGGSNLLFEIKHANDRLFIEDEVYYYFNALNTQNEKKFRTLFFFLPTGAFTGQVRPCTSKALRLTVEQT
ncbi:hypothetical protein KRR40_01375 [Niabella defluvii]|nr:hypothetical protein KRR40_01375 [Niabella sp. I65]